MKYKFTAIYPCQFCGEIQILDYTKVMMHMKYKTSRYVL